MNIVLVLDWWLVCPCSVSYFLLFKSLAAFIIIDQFLLETLLHLTPRISALLYLPAISLATPHFAVFAESFQLLIVECTSSNLKLAPFSVYNHFLFDFILLPNLIPGWLKLGPFPRCPVLHIKLPTTWHHNLAILP